MHLPKARIIYESRVVSSVVGIPYASIPQCAIYQHGAFEKTPSFLLLQHHHSSMFGAHWFFLWLDPVVLFALLDLVNLHGFVIVFSLPVYVKTDSYIQFLFSVNKTVFFSYFKEEEEAKDGETT